MARGRINPRCAKIHRSYAVADAACLFSVHRNTVRNWIKGGLPVVKTTGETLILGCELQAFLARKQAARRRKCRAGELYCLKCREPRRPRPGSLSVVQVTPVSANVAALCETCGTRMHRRASPKKLADAGFGEAPVQAGGLAPSRLAEPLPELSSHKDRLTPCESTMPKTSA